MGESLKEYKSILLDDLSVHLKPRGFKKSGNNFIKKINDLAYFIQVQSSTSSNSKSFKFTLNIGIGSMKIFELENVDTPNYLRCHWRQRIGYYTSHNKDYWWTATSSIEARKNSEEVVHVLITKVLPDLEQYKDANDLITYWQSGKCQGLTEGQRKFYLQMLKG